MARQRTPPQPLVGIIMGSQSDWETMQHTAAQLDALGVPYEDTDVSRDPALRADMEARSGRRTVPQIWIGDRHMGGFDDVNALHARGMLMPLLTGGEPSAPASGE